MSKDKSDCYREAFDTFDENGDGTLCVKELMQIMMCVGFNPTDDDMPDYMAMLDKNKDDKIDYDEFKNFMEQVEEKTGDPDEELRNAFKEFDKDESGFLDRNEIKVYLTKDNEEAKEEDVDDLLAALDTNGDGLISIEEFVKVLQCKN